MTINESPPMLRLKSRGPDGDDPLFYDWYIQLSYNGIEWGIFCEGESNLALAQHIVDRYNETRSQG